MGVYFTIYCLLVFGALILSKSNSSRKGSRLYCIIIFILLFSISAFRDINVGGDLQRYLPTYNRVSNSNWNEIMIWNNESFSLSSEFGFRIIQKIMSYLSSSNDFYLIFTSLLIIGVAILSINKYSDNVYISIIIYYVVIYLASFNIIRASICISIFLYIYKYIVERRFINFIVLVFLAFTIQKTSLFMIPAYFLWGKRVDVKYISLFLFGSIFFSYAVSGIYLVSIVNTFFSIYDLQEGDQFLVENATITKMAVFLILIMYSLIYIKNKYHKEDQTLDFFILMAVCAAFFQIFSSNFGLLNRISLIYFSYSLYSIPYIFERNKSHVIIKLGLLVFMVLLCALMYADLDTNGSEIVPYSSSKLLL